MIVSRGMGVVGKGPGLAQNALFHFPLGYDVRGEEHGLRKESCHWVKNVRPPERIMLKTPPAPILKIPS